MWVGNRWGGCGWLIGPGCCAQPAPRPEGATDGLCFVCAGTALIYKTFCEPPPEVAPPEQIAIVDDAKAREEDRDGLRGEFRRPGKGGLERANTGGLSGVADIPPTDEPADGAGSLPPLTTPVATLPPIGAPAPGALPPISSPGGAE